MNNVTPPTSLDITNLIEELAQPQQPAISSVPLDRQQLNCLNIFLTTAYECTSLDPKPYDKFLFTYFYFITKIQKDLKTLHEIEIKRMGFRASVLNTSFPDHFTLDPEKLVLCLEIENAVALREKITSAFLKSVGSKITLKERADASSFTLGFDRFTCEFTTNLSQKALICFDHIQLKYPLESRVLKDAKFQTPSQPNKKASFTVNLLFEATTEENPFILFIRMNRFYPTQPFSQHTEVLRLLKKAKIKIVLLDKDAQNYLREVILKNLHYLCAEGTMESLSIAKEMIQLARSTPLVFTREENLKINHLLILRWLLIKQKDAAKAYLVSILSAKEDIAGLFRSLFDSPLKANEQGYNDLVDLVILAVMTKENLIPELNSIFEEIINEFPRKLNLYEVVTAALNELARRHNKVMKLATIIVKLQQQVLSVQATMKKATLAPAKASANEVDEAGQKLATDNIDSMFIEQFQTLVTREWSDLLKLDLMFLKNNLKTLLKNKRNLEIIVNILAQSKMAQKGENLSAMISYFFTELSNLKDELLAKEASDEIQLEFYGMCYGFLVILQGLLSSKKTNENPDMKGLVKTQITEPELTLQVKTTVLSTTSSIIQKLIQMLLADDCKLFQLQNESERIEARKIFLSMMGLLLPEEKKALSSLIQHSVFKPPLNLALITPTTFIQRVNGPIQSFEHLFETYKILSELYRKDPKIFEATAFKSIFGSSFKTFNENFNSFILNPNVTYESFIACFKNSLLFIKKELANGFVVMKQGGGAELSYGLAYYSLLLQQLSKSYNALARKNSDRHKDEIYWEVYEQINLIDELMSVGESILFKAEFSNLVQMILLTPNVYKLNFLRGHYWKLYNEYKLHSHSIFISFATSFLEIFKQLVYKITLRGNRECIEPTKWDFMDSHEQYVAIVWLQTLEHEHIYQASALQLDNADAKAIQVGALEFLPKMFEGLHKSLGDFGKKGVEDKKIIWQFSLQLFRTFPFYENVQINACADKACRRLMKKFVENKEKQVLENILKALNNPKSLIKKQSAVDEQNKSQQK